MNKMDVDLTLKDIVDFLYPIGSLYYTQNSSFNPNTHFGGTWVQIKDKFILACGDTYKINQTGGEASHQLTIKEMPSHVHAFEGKRQMYDMGTQGGYGCAITDVPSNQYIAMSRQENYVGGNYAHNNMPPYETAFVWKRTGE